MRCNKERRHSVVDCPGGDWRSHLGAYAEAGAEVFALKNPTTGAGVCQRRAAIQLLNWRLVGIGYFPQKRSRLCCHMGSFGLRGSAPQLNQPGRVVDAIINRKLERAIQPPESLVLPSLDKETENSFFTERLGGFQPMQAFNEHEPTAVRPYLNWRLLAVVEHARGDFVYALLIKGGTPLDWHVDVRDRDGLALQHARFT